MALPVMALPVGLVLPCFLFLESLDPIQCRHQQSLELGNEGLEAVSHGLYQGGRGGRRGVVAGNGQLLGRFQQRGPLVFSQLDGTQIELGSFHVSGNDICPGFVAVQMLLVEINGFAQGRMSEVGSQVDLALNGGKSVPRGLDPSGLLNLLFGLIFWLVFL